MSQVINWIKDTRQVSETFFVSEYGSMDQEQKVEFYARDTYQQKVEEGYWDGYLIDMWNTGDCSLSELKWLPEFSTSNPLWTTVAQNHSPSGANYFSYGSSMVGVLKNRFKDILSGEILQFTFISSAEQYFAHTTGVVKP